MDSRKIIVCAATLLSGLGLAGAAAARTAPGMFVPSGQQISPLAAPGATYQTFDPDIPGFAQYRAGQAIQTALSPDGTTLLVLTSGYNNLNFASGPKIGQFDPAASYEHVFVYDVAGAHAKRPLLKQVIPVADTFEGMRFAPDGAAFYVSGGVDDDIYAYTRKGAAWVLRATIKLGHAPTAAQIAASLTFDKGGIGFLQSPSAAGLAVSADGTLLAVANIYNNSISVIRTATNKVAYEYNLQPFNTTPATGQGVAGGERPFSVAIAGDRTLYVSSLRDREIVVLNIAGASASTPPRLIARIKLPGTPNSLLLDNQADPKKLYVTQDNSDYVAVIDTGDNNILEEIDAIGPAGITDTAERYTGAAPNNLALRGTTLYVTNGGQNAVALIALRGKAPHRVSGLIPTGWYPNALSVSKDGAHLYIVNARGPSGPNAQFGSSSSFALKDTIYPGGDAAAQKKIDGSNEYDEQLEQAGLLSVPVPDRATLARLTAQVAANDLYSVKEAANAAATMAALRQKITHVIYIVKENRTYDQILGDLGNGADGDPALAVFGARVTPNFHAIATHFVTLDNFYDPAEVSGDGWEWSTQAREVDLVTKQIPLNYAASPTPSVLNQGMRGAPYESEGQNSNVDVGIPTLAKREIAIPLYDSVSSVFPGGTANFFPGTNSGSAADGPDGRTQHGYLWDGALRAGLSIRNYGFFIDLIPYRLPARMRGYIAPGDATPYEDGKIQAYASDPTLVNHTDPYFRGFDNNYPDFWRFNEWDREFQQFVVQKNLPNLTLLRLMHDHMGDFGSTASAATGLNYPEAQQADNDYAVGLVAQAVAHSPYRGNTLIFVVEDDSQDGPDHVDAHRSTAYVIGPYVKHDTLIHTRYTTVNLLRTMEDILGIDHLNLNDAYAAPMWNLFDLHQADWTYDAVASSYLRHTADGVPGTRYADALPARPVRPASWWARQTRGFDWSQEDRVPADLFNRIIWRGFEGAVPYPVLRNPTGDVGDDD